MITGVTGHTWSEKLFTPMVTRHTSSEKLFTPIQNGEAEKPPHPLRPIPVFRM